MAITIPLEETVVLGDGRARPRKEAAVTNASGAGVSMMVEFVLHLDVYPFMGLSLAVSLVARRMKITEDAAAVTCHRGQQSMKTVGTVDINLGTGQVRKGTTFAPMDEIMKSSKIMVERRG